MRRIVNYRPICFFALFEALGLFTAAVGRSVSAVRIFAISAALFAAAVLLIYGKKKFIYIPAAFTLGILLFSGVYDIYQSRAFSYGDAEITATIASEIIDADDYFFFEAENISVGGEKLKGRATVYAYSLPEERAGDEIKIKGKISTREFTLDGKFLSKYAKKNFYTVSAVEIEGRGKGKTEFISGIRLNLKRKLYAATDSDTTGIVSALLFGDKFAVYGGFYENVIDSGLAHIFAVSGLHIGILAAVFYYIAKKLKLNGKRSFIVVTCATLLYGAMCGYPPSVVRAIVMTSVFMLASALGRKRDNMNSLSLAAVIVMTAYPAQLFSAGFLMSFFAVLGILVLNKPLNEKLGFLPRGIRDITSTSLSVNIMLLPIMCAFFGKVQILFLISNLIILPILPFIFIISLIICLLVMIMPFAAPLLGVLSAVVWPIKFVSTAIGGLALSSFAVKSAGLLSIAFYAVLLITSRYVNLTKVQKGALCLSVTAVVFAVIVAADYLHLELFTSADINAILKL